MIVKWKIHKNQVHKDLKTNFQMKKCLKGNIIILNY